MIVWLDHLIFGNGHGLASPYCDSHFYWLNGEVYHWIGGHGAQLASFQWTHPKPGERRIIRGVEFQVFRSDRKWLTVGPGGLRLFPLPIARVEVTWAMVGFPHNINLANAALACLKDIFQKQSLYMPPDLSQLREIQRHAA